MKRFWSALILVAMAVSVVVITTEGEVNGQDDGFLGWVTEDGASGYPAARGRYH